MANAGRVGPLLAALVIGVVGCGDGSERGSVEAEEPGMTPKPGELRCGRPFELPGPDGLRLAGHFPERVPAGRQTLNGVVEVTSRKAIRGVAAAAADAFLVRGDQVVTTPMARDTIGVRWELAAGETRRVPAVASLVSCEPDRGPLPPGRYELYARMVVTPDDGAPQQVFGGPWRLLVQ